MFRWPKIAFEDLTNWRRSCGAKNDMIFWVTSPWSFPKKSRLRAVNFKRIRFELSKIQLLLRNIDNQYISGWSEKSQGNRTLNSEIFRKPLFFPNVKKSQLNRSPLCKIYRKHVYFWKVPIKSDFQKRNNQYMTRRSKNPN